MAGRIALAHRHGFGLVQPLDRAQANLHPRQLARLHDRIGMRDHPHRIGVDRRIVA